MYYYFKMQFKLINFDIDFDFEDSSYRGCYFENNILIFIKFKKYKGPITLQYLSNGGIQSIYKNKLIIKVNNGYLEVSKLYLNNKSISSKKFINLYKEKLSNYCLKGDGYKQINDKNGYKAIL